MKEITPNYKKIYKDLVAMKYPEKEKQCRTIFRKEKLTPLDVLSLNHILFGYQKDNQKFKSYTPEVIREILSCQRKKKLTNTALAKEFKLSRNTVTKWKKMFPELT
ncbi:MAG: helix-turn-helix domain-containing protein [Chryseobacterium sp.]|jgi:hypothetical protein|uniref:helix-turn-helix domain-containing protein n=1 Tax=Chryseobacterium sp. TaxID=1871047 RepID=UPI00282BEAFB|nr:helix-turn-helix domain-containing protein [Chryseobacterium sp.]MDR2235261.1 helix-turn-helix domain-containing protein [Chryseobacterium sp.]